MRMKNNEFKEKIFQDISVGDYLVTGLPENNSEIQQQIDYKRNEVKTNAKKWTFIGGPFAIGVFADCLYTCLTGNYDSIAYQAMPYLQTGAIISNFIYGIKTAIPYQELNSWKRVCELGKSIEDKLLD